MSRHTDISITCEDGYTLAASLYYPSDEPSSAVLIGPATGIKRQFYHNFAEFLVQQGYGVLTFDNRGIGQSLKGKVSHSDASLQQWGQLDLPAALTTLQQAFPDAYCHLIGHSAGGQLVGLMPNGHELRSMFNVAGSSGRLKNMKLNYRFKAHFFMNFYIPVSNLLFGHTKSQWVGMGEPLPKRVARQWQQWCNGEGYVKTAFGHTIHEHWYDDLSIPSMWVNAIDDDIAIDENVHDMMSVFTRSTPERLRLKPAEHGLKEIGHMKFFSRKSSELWRYPLEWIERHS